MSIGSEAMPCGAAAPANQEAPEWFVRFNPGQRIEHVVLMVTFTVLSVTGLAQRFYPGGWAEWLILNMGGIDNVRLVHRGFALLFVLSAIYHFGYLGYSLLTHRGKASMVPTLKDFRDVVAVVRYSFGLTSSHPEFGRFDYRQKFEYWGLMFGSFVIIVTGFLLAFPVAATRFLPGQVIAAAVQFHGYEATLAVLTIIIWHLYDVILKPGIFPADTSIFTGRISANRPRKEHALEYAELVAHRAARSQQAAGTPHAPRLRNRPLGGWIVHPALL